MTSPQFEVLATDDLADYSFLRIQSRTIQAPDGTTVERIVVVHPGAVAIVPMIGDDIVLIRQYRAPVDSWILEIPAGKLDESDIDRESAARRELAEEIGMSTERFVHLGSVQTGVGFTDEEITIYLAEITSADDTSPDGPEEAAAEILRVPFASAIDMVTNGAIKDAKTIAGLMLARAHRDNEGRPA